MTRKLPDLTRWLQMDQPGIPTQLGWLTYMNAMNNSDMIHWMSETNASAHGVEIKEHQWNGRVSDFVTFTFKDKAYLREFVLEWHERMDIASFVWGDILNDV